MSKIRVLPNDVADKIAAGEVVERPFNVVKELVENSLDAGADKIEIELIDGGLSLIKVSDNGIGIEKEDLPLTIKRFATSKISNYEDIFNINSFGFRGEALAAISSVSDFSIKSNGYELRVNFGKIEEIYPASFNPGTIVTVKKLFEKIPARHKFLKSPIAEFKEIIKLLKHIALLNYNVSFKLINNNNVVLDLKKDSNMISRAKKVLDENYNFIMINYQNEIKITGVITPPNIQKLSKDNIFIGVNKRAIKDNQIIQAVIQGYYRKLPENRYPVAVINIEIPPDQIDVNVHPAKLFVRFYNSRLIFKEVYKAIEESLDNKSSNLIDNHNIINQNVQKNIIKEQDIKYTVDLTQMVNIIDIETTDNNDDFEELLNNEFKIIGQLFDTIILIEKDNELWMIDQHIAHERVLYEKLLNNNETVSSIYLTEPILINLDDDLLTFCEKNREKLLKCGLDFEEFGKNIIKINAVPNQFLNMNIEEEIKELIANSANDIDENILEPIFLNMSCKMAIKAGEKLLKNEMYEIVLNLLKCSNPFTCPHGRPIIYRVSKEEIFKRFNRQ
ncbi:DNA mismatch repair endonuclease MutL [Deferribacter thermophilus]|uniref:DNA mismatch repair endonuclease MutL n=1 Tax=Deferribacter thermophilus TaxID=53573 RepID=UPI003C151B9F